jgi:hypothetical protein
MGAKQSSSSLSTRSDARWRSVGSRPMTTYRERPAWRGPLVVCEPASRAERCASPCTNSHGAGGTGEAAPLDRPTLDQIRGESRRRRDSIRDYDGPERLRDPRPTKRGEAVKSSQLIRDLIACETVRHHLTPTALQSGR